MKIKLPIFLKIVFICFAVGILSGSSTFSADHLDPPGRTDPGVDASPDLASDIDDVFAWQTDKSVIIIVTFGGPAALTASAAFDRDVLYKINISSALPADTADTVITAQFGPGANANEWGVRVAGLPGVTGALEGSVDTDLVKDGVKVRAGMFDEPFFFDLVGFRETRSMGLIRFDRSRNFFAKANDTAIVIEIPKERFSTATTPLGIWAVTSRFGGQI